MKNSDIDLLRDIQSRMSRLKTKSARPVVDPLRMKEMREECMFALTELRNAVTHVMHEVQAGNTRSVSESLRHISDAAAEVAKGAEAFK